MKKPITLVIILFSLLVSCKEDITNPVSNEPNFLFADTLECNITDGVIMKLINIDDIYDINEDLKGNIILSNLSDTSTFSVYWHAYEFTVYNEKMEKVGHGQYALGPHGFNLNIDDSYTYDVWWSKNTYSKANKSDFEWPALQYGFEFPAFPGNYLLEFELSGNPNFRDKHLYKWIKISKSGEQSVFDFQNPSEDYEKAILIMVVRNRFPTEFRYNFVKKAEANIFIIDRTNQDTVFQTSIPFENSLLAINPSSDSVLFNYTLNKKDSLLKDLSGTYDIKAVFNFSEKNLSLTSSIAFR